MALGRGEEIRLTNSFIFKFKYKAISKSKNSKVFQGGDYYFYCRLFRAFSGALLFLLLHLNYFISYCYYLAFFIVVIVFDIAVTMPTFKNPLESILYYFSAR